MTEKQSTKLIRAAGGLVWRMNKVQPEILVIHRSRYNDWTLPKGKLKEDERWEDAAVREVSEETGYRVEITSFANSLFYYVSEQPKIVLFWNMRVKSKNPKSERATDSPDEGDRLKWLTVDKAMKLISYEDEKGLILAGEKPMVESSKSYSSSFNMDPLIEKMGWLKRARLGNSGVRLRISLEVYYSEMRQLELRFFNSRENINWDGSELLAKQFDGLANLLKKTSEALKANEVELGWESFNAAQRMETQIYHAMAHSISSLHDFGKDQFEGRALNVFTEAQRKLSGWRKEVVSGLLEKKGTLKKNPNLSEVIQAQHVLSEYFSNGYRRLNILSSQIKYLEIMAILAVLTWIPMLIFKPYLDTESGSVFSPFLTLSTLLFGILGACISGIFRLEKRSTQQKIPEQLESMVYMIARPLVGAVSALAVVIFVLAGILDIGSQTPGLYLAAAFIAGFSERLLELGTGKFDEEKSNKKD